MNTNIVYNRVIMPTQLKWTTNVMESVSGNGTPTTICHPSSQPHALYNGVVFVVWMFGLYLFLSGISKLINSCK